MEKFKLSHLTLYAKGWYQKSDDIWNDLKEILKLDDYTPFTNYDVYSIILNSFQNFNNQRSTELKEVLNGIHPNNCWKYGYFVKDNHQWFNDKIEDLPNYDMQTAFIYYVLSSLRFLESDLWEVKTPKYKLFPKNRDIPTKRVIEQFNTKKL
jgi:hypothetical protein